MSLTPLKIFGFIMSFAYIFFGLLFLMTPVFEGLIENPQYRKILGGVLTAYGLFRMAYFLRQLRKKN
ncbi:MAG: hypothetical protein HY063_08625 [Bacteroidetes bacterium]|nr:hypothetical protein [Bacteroidota bacterium]